MYKNVLFKKIYNYRDQLMRLKKTQHVSNELILLSDFIEHMAEHCEGHEIYLFQLEDYVNRKGGDTAKMHAFFESQLLLNDFFNEWRRESQNSPDELKSQGCPGLEYQASMLSL